MNALAVFSISPSWNTISLDVTVQFRDVEVGNTEGVLCGIQHGMHIGGGEGCCWRERVKVFKNLFESLMASE